jgi:hypothetical protein
MSLTPVKCSATVSAVLSSRAVDLSLDQLASAFGLPLSALANVKYTSGARRLQGTNASTVVSLLIASPGQSSEQLLGSLFLSNLTDVLGSPIVERPPGEGVG